MTPKHLMLPDEKFVAKTSDANGSLTMCRRLWGRGSFDDPALEETPLSEVEWATLFTYMHRRFGPPHVGGDEYKDLSAGWLLTTPHARTMVLVQPSLSGPGFSFFPYFEATADEADFRRDLVLPPDTIKAVRAAYQATLLDLLRPVGVHDSLINALGEVEPSDEAGDLDTALVEFGADDTPRFEVERHSSSGYAMPQGLFGGKDWAVLCTLISDLGAGDVGKGRTAAIRILRAPIYAEVSRAPLDVRRLISLVYPADEELKSTLALSEDDLAIVSRQGVALRSSGSEREETLLGAETLPAVDAAVSLLDRLGLFEHGLRDIVSQYQVNVAVRESWEDLRAMPGEDVKIHMPPFRPLADRATPFRDACAALGRPDLIEWAERVLAKPSGQTAFAHLLAYLEHEGVVAYAQVAPDSASDQSAP